jgi:hypothetical protein
MPVPPARRSGERVEETEESEGTEGTEGTEKGNSHRRNGGAEDERSMIPPFVSASPLLL